MLKFKSLFNQVSAEVKQTASSVKLRRNQLGIMADILEITKDGTLKTQIMYKANLSFTQLTDYLVFMLNQNLIVHTSDGGREVYKVTEKGLDFLQRHQELVQLLKTKPPENKT
jgi:predicted transcriptional regulator